MENYKEDIKFKLKTLPEKPGIYQYFNDKGKIIYVGKAKNLKRRVTSYFTKNHDTAKTRILVRNIRDIKYIVVDTELDALLLENNLIKKYQPKYNIQLKDDKTYPWICIKNEPFPRVFSTRRIVKDGSQYFGPYPSVKVMNTLLELIRELYPIRTCNLDLHQNKIEEKKYKVCLEYHIGNCLGPCVGKDSKKNYDEYIKQIKHIVKGNISSLIKDLKEKMAAAAEQYAFEEAQNYKLKIESLEKYKAKSTVVSPVIDKVDVITMLQDEKSAFVNYLMIANGAIINGFTVEVKKNMAETKEEILAYVLLEMRERFKSISKEVLVEEDLNLEFDEFKFFTPQRGDKKYLIDLSLKNARFFQMDKYKQEKIKNPEKHANRILETIQKDFRLQELPVHMECFDNSNIQGTNPVSACVVFKNAKPSKKDYRHFNIKTVVGPDDYASMTEAVYRRYKRLLDEEEPLPQLIVIDGGKGQLGAALEALEQLGLRGKIAIVGIAKRLEEIFFPGDSLPLYLDKKSESLKVIQHMRNEAHRFGITHHRNRRSKAALVSEITQINGIGPKTQEDLMKAFKTISNIKKAKKEEIESIVGFSKAKLIWEYFH
ncbi:Excinuclease ABC subunit C [Lishizhenia tianjinensis]|uniref:UvrABC system protein C n=1 Tax=Lishizhenia tianjinensis TaxID=477690 RepID=A0A1I7BW78_9FLAO|nr:excinuclease ABC subunit UvrC [Lishizhenia tianjinensis]SFT91425.1 Excinuclease ABC subunit C [Lishizhenia tianjinensis]